MVPFANWGSMISMNYCPGTGIVDISLPHMSLLLLFEN